MTHQHASRRPGSSAAPAVAVPHDAVGKRTLVDAVQRRVEPGALGRDPGGPGREPDAVKAAAARGTSGPAQPLPHLVRIQQLFGRHDVTSVQSHVGGIAAEGAAAMGAEAYATGDHVAFASAPDLHTAAHEAAHVVQQRAGVQLKAGVGELGDSHEQHADAVADAVVAGRSAEALLDAKAPAARSAPQGDAVQRKQGFDRSEAYKDPQLDQASRLIHTAMMKTPALQKFFAFLKCDENATFLQFDTYDEDGGAFGKTNVLISIDDKFYRVDELTEKGLAKVNAKTEVMLRIMLNTAKIGKALGGGGKDQTVGINEIVNTLAHELSLHAARFQSIGEEVQKGTTGAALGKFLSDGLEKGAAFDDEVAHMELLTGKNTEYEELQKTVVALIKEDPKNGLDAERYQRDMVRDRAAQAMAMRLTGTEQEANALHARIVEGFQKAAAKQAVDYDVLKKEIGEFLEKVTTWRKVESGLFKQFPLLRDVAALTFFEAKYDQLGAKRTHLAQLMQEDMARRKSGGK